MNQRKAVGIDLGTTFSAVAHIDAYGKPQIVPNAESERITPSVILFDGSNVIVGTTAKNNAVAEPEKIVDFVKREMGKPKEQFHREFAGKVYSAEECSALILKKLKLDAEKYLKQPITDAVITVPAYFNDAERTATITAGQLAGFNVLQIINEPTAAALAYGLDKLNEDQTVFVFDLGGGTFDVTIMRIQGQHIEDRSKHLVEKCETICEMGMQEANMTWDDIDKILLVGGMTRMPMVRTLVSQLTKAPVIDDVNPDEAVAKGASIQAILSLLEEEKVSGEQVLPTDTRDQFVGREGGLIQVTNITSHTLGVVLWDEVHLEEYVFPMIRKMTAIPARARNSFGTAMSNMQRAVVRVVEGESTLPGECTPLGICDVELPAFLPKGSPVELTYEYNANQVLEVSVEASGNRAKVSIERNTGLAPNEVAQAAANLGSLRVA